MSFVVLLLCALQAAAAGVTVAQSEGGPERPTAIVRADGEVGASKWRGEPISLSLKDADLPEVLRSFAKLTRMNLVLDPRVEGKVTVELHDVPWDQALSVILKAHGLGIEVDGRVLSVARASVRPPPR